MKRSAIQILKKYLQGNASDEERALINKWYDEMDEEGNKSGAGKNTSVVQVALYQRIRERLKQDPPAIPIYRTMVFRIAAAVFIALAIGVGSFLFFDHLKGSEELPKITDVTPPDRTHATITLNNGQVVELSKLNNGSLAQGHGTLMRGAAGEVIYTAENLADYMPKAMNTLRNPRGSRVVHVQLSDGTHVWLNAGSSLTYPVVFPHDKREVTMVGEAYFEVKQQTSAPFLVTKNNMQVRVLGTHFNVEADSGDSLAKVSLLEGRVNIVVRLDNGGVTSHDLTPGQQSQVADQSLKVISDIDTAAVMAWKNDKFIFNGNSIYSVMHQIEKWYNVRVEYRGRPTTEDFVGVISREVKLSQILNMLEKTNTVSFEVEPDKIIVK